MLPDPRSLEDELFQSTWDDGLLDLFLGVSLLLIGVGWHLDQIAIGSIAPALLVSTWAPIRQRFVEPRSGYVELGARTQRKTRRGLWAVLALGVVALGLGVALYLQVRAGSSPSTLIAGLPALLLALGAAVTGAVLRIPRLGLYALALAAAGVATGLIGLDPSPSMLVSGLIITAAGALRFSRFLRTHPVEEAR